MAHPTLQCSRNHSRRRPQGADNTASRRRSRGGAEGRPADGSWSMGVGYVWICLMGATSNTSLGPPVSGAIIELDLGCTGLQRATAAGGAWRVVRRLELGPFFGRMRAPHVDLHPARGTANQTCSYGGTPGICWSRTRSAVFGVRHPVRGGAALHTPAKRATAKKHSRGTRHARAQAGCTLWGCAGCGRVGGRGQQLRSSTAGG
jgi:hypothetical protein